MSPRKGLLYSGRHGGCASYSTRGWENAGGKHDKLLRYFLSRVRLRRVRVIPNGGAHERNVRFSRETQICAPVLRKFFLFLHFMRVHRTPGRAQRRDVRRIASVRAHEGKRVFVFRGWLTIATFRATSTSRSLARLIRNFRSRQSPAFPFPTGILAPAPSSISFLL